jgi:hypothetical protein
MAVQNEFGHVKRAEEIKEQLNDKFANMTTNLKPDSPRFDHEVH